MTTFLDLYKGAAIYEVGEVDPSEGEKLGAKLIAKGMLPEPKNLKVDFIEEAENRKQAVKAIKAKIDRYLDKYEIEEFVFEHPDQ